jgi:hypothetical protein
MEKHDQVSHFAEQLSRAKFDGFLLDFQFTPSGSVRCINCGQVFTAIEISPQFESCGDCRTTFYRITVQGGYKGTAIEFWES